VTDTVELLALLLAQHLGSIILSFSIIISTLLLRKQISQLIQTYPVKSPNPASENHPTIQKEEEKPSQIQIKEQEIRKQQTDELKQKLASLEEEEKKNAQELAERRDKINDELNKLGAETQTEPQAQKLQKRKPKPQETTSQEPITLDEKLLELAKGESHE
jgi:hypothetical protein